MRWRAEGALLATRQLGTTGPTICGGRTMPQSVRHQPSRRTPTEAPTGESVDTPPLGQLNFFLFQRDKRQHGASWLTRFEMCQRARSGEALCQPMPGQQRIRMNLPGNGGVREIRSSDPTSPQGKVQLCVLLAPSDLGSDPSTPSPIITCAANHSPGCPASQRGWPVAQHCQQAHPGQLPRLPEGQEACRRRSCDSSPSHRRFGACVCARRNKFSLGFPDVAGRSETRGH